MKPKTIKLSQIIMKYGCNVYHILDAIKAGDLNPVDSILFDKEEVEKWYKEKIQNVTGGRL